MPIKAWATAFRIDRWSQEQRNMRNLSNSIRRFLSSEDAVTAIDCAVMLALITIVCLTAVASVRTTAGSY